ncbi:MAG: porin family protein [Pseudomonadales bacterium]|jgi:opacity protein-like surface antigen|nr:porin family protein [Pseudomonadales bacterium]
MKKIISGMLLTAATAGAAAAEPGVYYGAGLGLWSVDFAGLDAQAAQVRGQVGYRFNDFVAVEGSLHNYFEAEDNGIEFDAFGAQLAVRPSFPLSDAIEGYARLGWGYYDAEASGFGVGVDTTDDEFVWGIGTNFKVSERVGVYVEYSDPFDSEADVFTLGFTYHPQGR